jgi:hypothetical protein
VLIENVAQKRLEQILQGYDSTRPILSIDDDGHADLLIGEHSNGFVKRHLSGRPNDFALVRGESLLRSTMDEVAKENQTAHVPIGIDHR